MIKKLTNYLINKKSWFKTMCFVTLIALVGVNVYMVYSLCLLPIVLISMWHSFRALYRWRLDKKLTFVYDCVCWFVIVFVLYSVVNTWFSFTHCQLAEFTVCVQHLLNALLLDFDHHFHVQALQSDELPIVPNSNNVLFTLRSGKTSLQKAVGAVASRASSSSTRLTANSPGIITTLMSKFSTWSDNWLSAQSQSRKHLLDSIDSSPRHKSSTFDRSTDLLTLADQSGVIESVPKSCFSIDTPNAKISILVHSHQKSEIPSLVACFKLNELSKLTDFTNPRYMYSDKRFNELLHSMKRHSSIAMLLSSAQKTKLGFAMSMATHTPQSDHSGKISDIDVVGNCRAQHFTSFTFAENAKNVMPSTLHSDLMIDFLCKNSERFNFACARSEQQHAVLHVWSTSPEQAHYMNHALNLLELTLKQNPNIEITEKWLTNDIFGEYRRKPNADLNFVRNTIDRLAKLAESQQNVGKELVEIV